MKNLGIIFLEGVYSNIKRILFASDRVTDMELRNKILNGEIVRVAKRIGKTAPLNEMLCHIAKEMANNRVLPGKYTPARLCKRLGLGSS